MPSFPRFAAWAENAPANVFAPLIARALDSKSRIIPLHVGDSHIAPPGEALACLPGPHTEPGDLFRYGLVGGRRNLRERLVHRVKSANGLVDAELERLFITLGATQGLLCTALTVLQPGDEAILLSPHYPLVPQMIAATGAKVVQVPFYDRLRTTPDVDPKDLIRPFITRNTAAIFLTNPNNPDGTVLTRAQLQSIAELVAEHGLWAVADEAYELVRYSDSEPHVSLGSFACAAPHTITAFSFSKGFGLAGLRVGYVVAPKTIAERLNDVIMLSGLQCASLSQVAALGALASVDTYVPSMCRTYQTARDLVHRELRCAFYPAQAGCYVFLDLGPHLRGLSTSAFLEKIVAETGVLLAPGAAFGDEYTTHARMCFTSVPPDVVADAVHRLNRFLNG